MLDPTFKKESYKIEIIKCIIDCLENINYDNSTLK
jgi:hypothetical protein